MSQILYKARLMQHGMGAGTPAWEIVTRPGHEIWNQIAAGPAAVINALCQNFYHYGRNNGWVWDSIAGANGNPLGVALNAGTTTQTNCGGFNGSVRWIAHNILGFTPLTYTNMGATTPAAFITAPGTQGIDAGWVGNVRTMTQDFANVGAYRFTAHSWNRLIPGGHYDASTNNLNFGNAFALYWCILTPVRHGAYMVSARVNPTLIPGAPPFYYCVPVTLLKQQSALFPIVVVGAPTQMTQPFINAQPNTSGAANWPAFVLVSAADLPPAFVTHIS